MVASPKAQGSRLWKQEGTKTGFRGPCKPSRRPETPLPCKSSWPPDQDLCTQPLMCQSWRRPGDCQGGQKGCLGLPSARERADYLHLEQEFDPIKRCGSSPCNGSGSATSKEHHGAIYNPLEVGAIRWDSSHTECCLQGDECHHASKKSSNIIVRISEL